jgi:ubiquinone/menaquinone biosynthesis C-methylase UbiE
MVILDNLAAYREKFRQHLRAMSESKAVKQHVGDPANFHRMGAIERAIVEAYGLPDDGYLIDVGCGAGRLTLTIENKPRLRYLGTDVVPGLIDYCRKTYRKDWRFETVEQLLIPEQDEAADMIVAFSLFTHLLHEQSYNYLADFHRVLKPGGLVVFSFLEFEVPGHRKQFMALTRSLERRPALVMFMDRGGIGFFADTLGFRLVEFVSGNTPNVTFDPPVELPDGNVLEGPSSLGQSLCVLEKTG